MTSLLGSATPGVMYPGLRFGPSPGLPAGPTVSGRLLRAVVDTHVHLPDMFELTFRDNDGSLVDDANLAIGTSVEVIGAKPDGSSSTSLISGEVTSIEAICAEGQILTIVRGYERAHRLQRGKHTKTFTGMRDSEIAAQVAQSAGLIVGDIDTSQVTHTHIAQIVQTDWDFLTDRAREIGFETGVVGGKFFFRKASGAAAGGGLGGALGSVVSAVAGALGLSSTLTFNENLRTFLPRVSGADLTTDVEVRVWDGEQARVVSAKTSTASGTATITGTQPGTLASTMTGGLSLGSIPTSPPIPVYTPLPGRPVINFGPTPGAHSYVLVDRPVAVGSNTDTAVQEVANGLAEHIGSTFAEAEGDAAGDPTIQAGSQVQIAGVPKIFAGIWTVTNARHVFDPVEGGYHTRFWVSGRANRSLLAMSSGGATHHQPQFGGLVCGIVTNVDDTDKRGKVKVALPWLSPLYESDWARVVQMSASSRNGTLFLPEVGDEVLVGFEFGDARRPFVLGALINKNSSYAPLGAAVTAGAVTQRGITSPAGNVLSFNDDVPPGPPGTAPPTTSKILLGTGDANIGLAIDQVGGTVQITCKPAPPNSRTPAGAVTIDCSGAGQITLNGGKGGVKIDSEGQLELSGQLGVKISSQAMVEVQGQMIKLN